MLNCRVGRLCQFALDIASVAILLTGCKCAAPVDSEVGTDSIHVYMVLQCAEDGTTSVRVELSVGGPLGSDIYLTGGDELEVTANGQSQKLEREDTWLNQVFYNGTLDTDEPGTEVTISFERPNHTSALDSCVTLPANIAIQMPQAGETFTRGDEITVSWEPSGGPGEVAIEFATICRGGQESYSKTTSYTASDSGSAAYPVASLLDESLEGNEVCDVTITLMRETTGSISAEYKSGEIVARRNAVVAVEISHYAAASGRVARQSSHEVGRAALDSYDLTRRMSPYRYE
jgi:hypothetical protein